MRYSLIFTLITLLFTGCSLGERVLSADKRTHTLEIQILSTQKSLRIAPKEHLKVMTLNLAHGRKESFSQLFLFDETFKRNLLEIAAFLKKENADIVALQEADGVSNWSGEFDHVAFLAQEAGYQWHVRGDLVNNSLGNYGTAILSRLPITDSFSFAFKPTPPTTKKGFSLAQVLWDDGKEERLIDIVSLHLDFLRQSKRDEQLEEMREKLLSRENELIMMGDFNADEKIVPKYADQNHYKVFRRSSKTLKSFSEDRIDWILITSALEFIDYSVAKEVLSDHRAVISHIGYLKRAPGH